MFSLLRKKSFYSSFSSIPLTPLRYDVISENVLTKLYDAIDLLSEKDLGTFDCEYSGGVLTFSSGSNIFVLNKQPSLFQIWLSSPISGPWRFNFIKDDWISKHKNTELHSLLSKELSEILNKEIKFIK